MMVRHTPQARGKIRRNFPGGMRIMLLLTIGFVFTQLAEGQSFNSTSTGSDGALDYTGMTGEVLFDPKTLLPPRDPDGDNVFHFTSIKIPANLTVRLRATELNYAPVYWLATGPVEITGTLELSGGNGHGAAVGDARTISIPGPGGFPGGLGQTIDSPPTAGSGPKGGPVNYGGSYGSPGWYMPADSVYGNLFILPSMGGSGGGGTTFSNPGAGGGAGGGAILIASSTSIKVLGFIKSNGGNGPYAPAGSGGAIRLLAPTIYGPGKLQAIGGACQGCSSHGGNGRVRIEAYHYSNPPTIEGVYRIVTLSPNVIFLPTQMISSVRVVSIDGVPVPPNPTGSFLVPDTIINKGGPVNLAIQAKNIPLGTVVKLHIFSETGVDQDINSSPLAGTLGNSTATAQATLPSGFSRCFVRATWTP